MWPGEQEKRRGLWRPKKREREIKTFYDNMSILQRGLIVKAIYFGQHY